MSLTAREDESVAPEVVAREGVRREGSARGNARRVVLALLTACYVVLWAGGVAQYWLKGGAGEGQSLPAALFLTVAGLIVLAGARAWGERLTLLAVALVGFVAEVVGVRAGVPFGAYGYTGALGPELLGVPPAIAFAWMTLAAYVWQMLLRLRLAPWIELTAAAAWLTALDLLIDPLASNGLGYWRWAERGAYFGVPLTNFAGWFAVGLLAFAILRKRLSANRAAGLTGLSVILFFTLLALAQGEALVALPGCALCLIHLLISRAGRRRQS